VVCSTLLHPSLGTLEKVIVPESRPGLEGVRTAEELAQRYPVELITESQIAFHVADCDLVLLGADSVMEGSWLFVCEKLEGCDVFRS
jgi:translation initiation factor 2B subunit (eIF-2B alpha/beta/delta family)